MSTDFRLTSGQFEALRGLQGGECLFLLVQGEKSVVVQLPLRGFDEYIRVLSAREQDLQGAPLNHAPADIFGELQEAAE